VSLKKLGRYDLVRVLGKGAMGVVYEGRDPNLERRVAIKTVKVENLSEEAAAEYESRFRTEARSAARLQHPNIVSVYDSDRDGDIAFLVMEYIQGDDLKHHLDRGVRYSLEQSLKMIRDLLAALDYAHKAGIVHRDIKPANLLIEPGGRVKLTDFGVARMQDSGEATRTQGSMVGTLKYMAPEQVQGLKIDSRADLFSVGVVLYQLLTDKRPFDGDNDFSIIHQIIGHTPPPPSSFNARLPPAIDAVVARALAKDREQRFATARDFAAALQSAIRRAEDATIVPPADPLKKPDSAGSSKGTVPSMVGSGTSGTSGSTATATVTVTQELELVYWKDIKDSGEPEDFEGFLQQFPAGIYADLARRRLRKLAGGSSPDQTVLTGQSSREEDLDATRLRADPSIPMAAPMLATPAAPTPVAAGPAAVTPAPSATPAVTPSPVAAAPAAVKTASAAGAAAAEAATVAAATAARLAAADGTTVPPTPSRARMSGPPATLPPVATPQSTSRAPASRTAKKPPIAVLAGVGAVVVAGLLAFMMTGRGSKTDVAAVPPVPPASQAASAAIASAPAPVAPDAASTAQVVVAAPPVDAPVAAAVTVAAPVASRPAHTASTPRKAASSSRRVPATSASATPPAFSNPVPAEARESRDAPVALRPSPPVAAAPRPAAPADTCKDKVFLSRQLCLQEECSKPIFQNTRACVAFREEARLREDSKVRN
jgi:serine/threonine protein kinase